MSIAIGAGIGLPFGNLAAGGALVPMSDPRMAAWFSAHSLSHIPYLGDVDRINNESSYYPLALRSDGATSNREVWTMGTKGNAVGMPTSWLIEFTVPSVNPTSPMVVAGFGPSDPVDPSSSASATQILNLHTDGTMFLRCNADTSNKRSVTFSGTPTVAANAGEVFRIVVVFTPDGVLPYASVNGAGFTQGTQVFTFGTPPDYNSSPVTKWISSQDCPGGLAPTSRIVIGALSDAEAKDWSAPGSSNVASFVGNDTNFDTGLGNWSSTAWDAGSLVVTSGTADLGSGVRGKAGIGAVDGGFSITREATYRIDFEFDMDQTTGTLNMSLRDPTQVQSIGSLPLIAGPQSIEVVIPASGGDWYGYRLTTTEQSVTYHLKSIQITRINAGTLPTWAQQEGDAEFAFSDSSKNSTFDEATTDWAIVGSSAGTTLNTTETPGSLFFYNSSTGTAARYFGFTATELRSVPGIGDTIRIMIVATDAVASLKLRVRGTGNVNAGLWDEPMTVGVNIFEVTLTALFQDVLFWTQEVGTTKFSTVSIGYGQPIIQLSDTYNGYSRGSTVVNSQWGDLQGTLVGLDYGRNDVTLPVPATMLQHEVKAGVKTGLRLPYVAGNYLSRSAVALDDDMDVIIRLTADDVTPGTVMVLASAWVAGDKSYLIRIFTGGELQLFGTADGSTEASAKSDDPISFVDNEIIYARITRRKSDGRVQFKQSSDRTNWVPIGLDEVVLAGQSLHTPTNETLIGRDPGAPTAHAFGGKCFEATFADTIDGDPIAKFDASSATPYQTTILDSVDGAEWTVSKSAAFTGQDGDGELFVGLPGTAGDYGTVPDTAALRINGDIDLRGYASVPSWGTAAVFIGGIGGGSDAYQLYVEGDQPKLAWFNSAGALQVVGGTGTALSSLFGSTNKGGVRATLDVDNGSTQHVVSFYYSTDSGANWVLQSAVTVSGITNIKATVAGLGLGTDQASSYMLGDLYSIEVRDGIDGMLVFDSTPPTLGATQWLANDPGLVLDGATGTYASTPDSAALDITGDIDLRVDVRAVDYVAAARLICKRSASGLSYDFYLNATGNLVFYSAADATQITSTAVTPFAANERGWLRCTWASASGDVSFYTSTDGSSWTQLGTTVSSAAGVLTITTVDVTLGIYGDFSSTPLNGKIYSAQIYDGIGGTKVFDSDFTIQPLGTTSFAESSSNAATVTLNGAAVIGPVVTVHQSNYDVARFEEALGNYTHLPGVAGNYVSGPAVIPASGERLRMRHEIVFNDYTPSVDETLSSVYATGNQLSWRGTLRTTGIYSLLVSTDGTSGTLSVYSTTLLIPELTKFVEVDWTVGTGFTLRISFDGITYNGFETVAGTAIPFAGSTANLNLGADSAGVSRPLSGRYTRFEAWLDEVKVRDYNAANGHANSVTVAGGEGTEDIYSSDFTADVDGWSAVSGSVISSVDDTLETERTGASGYANVTLPSTFNVGDRYSVTGKFQRNSTEVNTGFRVAANTGFGGALATGAFSFSAPSPDVWVEFSGTISKAQIVGLRIGSGSATVALTSVTGAKSWIKDIVITKLPYVYTINSTLPDPAQIVSAPLVWFNGTTEYVLLPYDIQQLAQDLTVIGAYSAKAVNGFVIGSAGAPATYLGRTGVDTVAARESITAVAGGTHGELLQVNAGVYATLGVVSQNGIDLATGDLSGAMELFYLMRYATFYANGGLSSFGLAVAVLPANTRKGMARYAASLASANIPII